MSGEWVKPDKFDEPSEEDAILNERYTADRRRISKFIIDDAAEWRKLGESDVGKYMSDDATFDANQFLRDLLGGWVKHPDDTEPKPEPSPDEFDPTREPALNGADLLGIWDSESEDEPPTEMLFIGGPANGRTERIRDGHSPLRDILIPNPPRIDLSNEEKADSESTRVSARAEPLNPYNPIDYSEIVSVRYSDSGLRDGEGRMIYHQCPIPAFCKCEEKAELWNVTKETMERFTPTITRRDETTGGYRKGGIL